MILDICLSLNLPECCFSWALKLEKSAKQNVQYKHLYGFSPFMKGILPQIKIVNFFTLQNGWKMSIFFFHKPSEIDQVFLVNKKKSN